MRVWLRNILCTAALSACGTSALALPFSTEVILSGGTSLGVIDFPAQSGSAPLVCAVGLPSPPGCDGFSFNLTLPGGPTFVHTEPSSINSATWAFDASHQLDSLAFNATSPLLGILQVSTDAGVSFFPPDLSAPFFDPDPSFRAPDTGAVPNPGVGTLFLAGALAGLVLQRRRQR